MQKRNVFFLVALILLGLSFLGMEEWITCEGSKIPMWKVVLSDFVDGFCIFPQEIMRAVGEFDGSSVHIQVEEDSLGGILGGVLWLVCVWKVVSTILRSLWEVRFPR